MNFLEFIDKFQTQDDVIDYFIKIRYKGEVHCHHCGCIGNIYQTANKRLFTCNNCHNMFSPFTNTIFENTKVDLRKWLYAIHLILNSKKGISGLQLQREVGVSYPTAWRILKKIRIAMGNSGKKDFRDTIIEIDETYIGGKPRKHNNKGTEVKSKRGRGSKKTPVIGVLDRKNKRIHVRVATENDEGQKLTGKQLLGVLEQVADKDDKNIVMTDEFRAYSILPKVGFDRRTINHQKIFSDGFVHVNNLEGFWGILKRGIYGIYHHVSVKHLQKYVNEFVFRYENKDNSEAFDVLLNQSIIA